jgi:hypothetical protein
MKLCGFDVGLDKPLFLIAGRREAVAAGPRCAGIGPAQRMRAGCEVQP